MRLTYFVVFLTGLSIFLTQGLMIRECSALMGSTELVIIWIATAHLLGLSIGYYFAKPMSNRWEQFLFAGTFIAYFSFPFLNRLLATYWAKSHNSHLTPIWIFIFVTFAGPPLLGRVIPLTIETLRCQKPLHGTPIKPIYLTELIGALFALLLLLIIPPSRFDVLYTIHLIAFSGIATYSLRQTKIFFIALTIFSCSFFSFFDSLHIWTLTQHYAQVLNRSTRHIQILASEYSPYQRVDIVGLRTNKNKYLYLNGVFFYGSKSLHFHNVMVAVLPQLMLETLSNQTLIVAGGSLNNVRHVWPLTKSLQVVEIDEAVTRLSRKWIQEPLGNFPTSWDLHINDGKHFLANSSSEYDVISIDVPIPLHLQTAMLHSIRFFELAKAKLSRRGIFAISLAGGLDDLTQHPRSKHRSAHRILSGLKSVFPFVYVIRIGGKDFAYGCLAPLELTQTDLQNRMAQWLNKNNHSQEYAQDFPDMSLLENQWIENQVKNVHPIRDGDLKLVWRLALKRWKERFYPP